jgi:hypothetical protein
MKWKEHVVLLNESDYLRDVDVDGRKLLKLILAKCIKWFTTFRWLGKYTGEYRPVAKQ